MWRRRARWRISGNMITAAGATALSDMMASNATLQRVSLKGAFGWGCQLDCVCDCASECLPGPELPSCAQETAWATGA